MEHQKILSLLNEVNDSILTYSDYSDKKMEHCH